MKLSVIYYSRSGNTKTQAENIAKGMEAIEGIEAKAFSIDTVDVDYVKESKGVVFGSPSYYATLAGEMKSWMDGNAARLGLAGKVCGAFATANYPWGGGDLAIRTMLDHAMVLGAMVYSGGGAYGQPFIHLGPVAAGTSREAQSVFDEIFETFGKRFAEGVSNLVK